MTGSDANSCRRALGRWVATLALIGVLFAASCPSALARLHAPTSTPSGTPGRTNTARTATDMAGETARRGPATGTTDPTGTTDTTRTTGTTGTAATATDTASATERRGTTGTIGPSGTLDTTAAGDTTAATDTTAGLTGMTKPVSETGTGK